MDSGPRLFRFPKPAWLNSTTTRTAGVYASGALVREYRSSHISILQAFDVEEASVCFQDLRFLAKHENQTPQKHGHIGLDALLLIIHMFCTDF